MGSKQCRLQPHKGTQTPDTLVLAQGHPGANADLHNYKVLSVYFTKIVIIHRPTIEKECPYIHLVSIVFSDVFKIINLYL